MHNFNPVDIQNIRTFNFQISVKMFAILSSQHEKRGAALQ